MYTIYEVIFLCDICTARSTLLPITSVSTKILHDDLSMKKFSFSTVGTIVEGSDIEK